MSLASPYSFKQRLLLGVGAPLVALCLRLLASSWRTQVLAPPGAKPDESDGPNVYAVWHDGIVAITGQWRDHSIQGLASQSFDGEFISRAMEHLGYPRLSRGSSSRGGDQGLNGQLEALREGRHVSITVDGPRGPRHECKPGAVVMAARSRRPLVPLVCVARGAWRLKNWDRTILPLPFAKLVFAFGEPIQVNEEGVSEVLAGLQQVMQDLEDAAARALSVG